MAEDPHAAMGVSRIAAFAVSWRARQLPEQVLHAGRRAILNALGASVGAMRTEPVRILRDWAARTGSGSARLMWLDETLPEDLAGLVNAAAMHVLDFDDTLVGLHVHASPVALAAGLSVADPEKDGGLLLQAFCLGVEAHFALARALMPDLFRRGFHISAVGGPVAAAVVVGTLLQLDERRMQEAIATAMISSGGLREGLTSMSNAYGLGHAARTGIAAARLAEAGFRSAPSAFEGPDGYVRAMSGVPPERAIAEVSRLGQRWDLPLNSHKRYPTETISQAAIQATLEIRASIGSEDALEVEDIRIAASPLVAEVVSGRSARTALDDVLARTFDTRFCVASAWIAGVFSPALMEPPPEVETSVLQLRRRVRVEPEPAFGNDAARVAVTLRDGRRLERTVAGYRGSKSDPMSDEDLETKLREAGKLDSARHARICREVWALGTGSPLGNLEKELGPV